MLHNINEKSWEQALKKDEKLRGLAIKAGVKNDYKRAKELNGCFALNCGDDVVRCEAERDLAKYLFCIEDDDSNSVQDSMQGRILAARAAGIGINDL